MFGTLDTNALNVGLKIGGRLIVTGNIQGSLAMLREVFAGAVKANRPTASSDLLPQLVKWIVPIARPKLFAGRDSYSDQLSSIIAELVSDGFTDEAMRVLVTAIGLNPRKAADLVAAAKDSLGKPVRSRAKAAEVGGRLMDVGMRYLKSGAADGIVLMSAAHRVGRIPLPVGDIGAAIDIIPDANANWTPVRKSDAQALTDYAYGLRRSGSLNTAVGVGMVIPPMLGDPSEPMVMDALASAAGGQNVAVVDVSRHFMAKGYVPQAGELLMASDAVSAKDLWNALDRTVIKPSLQVDPPPVLRSFTRSVGAAISSSAAKATEEPPDYKAFYFALEGEDVRCNEAKWDAEFNLVFNYDLIPTLALSDFEGKKFRAIIDGEAALEVHISPSGFTRRDRIPTQEVTFKDGKMEGEPLRFKLKAPAKNSGDHSDAGVLVTFSINCNMIYRTFLPIKLVDALGTEPCERRTVNLDLEEIIQGASRPRDAEVFVYTKGDVWEVSWTIKVGKLTDRSETQETTLLSRSVLKDAYKDQGFLTDLAAISRKAIWNQINENLALPDEDQFKLEAREYVNKAAAVGSNLYEIFRNEPVFAELLAKLDQLPEGSRIAVHTENVFFPWELIYTPHYDDGSPKDADHKRFWGARFHIESLIMDRKGEEKPLEYVRQPGKFYISMGLNTSIDQEDPWKGNPPGPAARQRQYFETFFQNRGSCVVTYASIKKMLTDADPASMIYFYCHGSAHELEIAKDTDPIKIAVVSETKYPHWPIVFINACDAADISPTSYISFRTKFRDKKAAGVIAPSFEIPVLFAAYFAKAVLAGYDERKPIGEIIFALRRQLLEQNNPLGLWYSVQCPLDVTAPEA